MFCFVHVNVHVLVHVYGIEYDPAQWGRELLTVIRKIPVNGLVNLGPKSPFEGGFRGMLRD